MRTFVLRDVTSLPEDQIPAGRRYKCPWCSRLVVCNDAELRSYHELPACKRYLAEVTKRGAELVIDA